VSPSRKLSREENALLIALLRGKDQDPHLVESLKDLAVREMNDGGMGSLLLLPEGLEDTARSFGKQLVLGEFIDSDGVPVSVTVNLDKEGRLYELDVWKVNFEPIKTWPDPQSVKILG
jgi:hypothetical protein